MKLKIVNKSSNPLPKYETNGSVGMDLIANGKCVLGQGCTRAVGTGVHIQIPEGYEGQVRSRSGHSVGGLVVANSPGTIDQDFTGEIKVILHNQSDIQKVINKGDRVAQLVIAPIQKIEWEEVGSLEKTERGENGFGSTGV